jgi:hypothetical protein
VGQSSCTPCIAGTYSTSPGATSPSTCKICLDGTYSSAGQSSCTPCQNYMVSLQGSTCYNCGPGEMGNNQKGGTRCIPLSAGYFNDGNGVTKCPTSSYSTGSASFCSLCDHGYTTTPNSLSTSISSCVPCQSGTYSTGPGTPCTPCPPGTYSPLSGRTSEYSCIQCPVNTISGTGSFICTPCGRGFNSDGRQCLCAAPKRVRYAVTGYYCQ